MNNFVQLFASISALLIASVCRPANADLILSVSADNGESFANSFEVGVGGSLDVSVFLQQRAPDTSLSSDGLVSWGFDLSRTSTNLGSLSNFSKNPVFDFVSQDLVTASGFELEFATTSTGGVTGNSILLGSFQFNASQVGTSSFTINDRLIGSGTANASWVTASFNELDEDLFGSGASNSFQFAINVTAVPEPSSLMLLICLTAPLAMHRRRRKMQCSEIAIWFGDKQLCE